MNELLMLPSSELEGIVRIKTLLPLPEQTVFMPGEIIDVCTLYIPGDIKGTKQIIKIIEYNLVGNAFFNSDTDEVCLLSCCSGSVTYFIVNKALLRHWHQLLRDIPGKVAMMPDWMIVPVSQTENRALGCRLNHKRGIYRIGVNEGGAFSENFPPLEGIMFFRLPLPANNNRQRFRKGWQSTSLKGRHVLWDMPLAKNAVQGLMAVLKILAIGQIFALSCLWLWRSLHPVALEVTSGMTFETAYRELKKVTDSVPMVLTGLEYRSHELDVTIHSDMACGEIAKAMNKLTHVRSFRVSQEAIGSCQLHFK